MVVSALSFLAGLMLVQQFPILPDVKWLIVGGVLVGIIAWLRYWRCLFFCGRRAVGDSVCNAPLVRPVA